MRRPFHFRRKDFWDYRPLVMDLFFAAIFLAMFIAVVTKPGILLGSKLPEADHTIKPGSLTRFTNNRIDVLPMQSHSAKNQLNLLLDHHTRINSSEELQNYFLRFPTHYREEKIFSVVLCADESTPMWYIDRIKEALRKIDLLKIIYSTRKKSDQGLFFLSRR